MRNNKTIDTIDKIASSPFASLISLICSVLGLLISLFNNIIIKIIAIVLFFVAIGFGIYSYYCYKSNKKKIIDIFSKEFWEIIKSENFEYKEGFDEINNGDIASYQHLNNLLKPLSDCIADFSRLIINEKTSVCIKMIETESLMDKNIDSWKIRTIARCKYSKPNRRKKDGKSVLLSQNSDFHTIITGEVDCFAVPSLPRLEKQWADLSYRKKYENSNPNYKREYSSTIVFPIKTSIDSVSNIIKSQISFIDDLDYHIIGFLCWDSKLEFDDDDKSFCLLTELLESFSEILYPLLEKYIVYQLDGFEQPIATVSSDTQ